MGESRPSGDGPPTKRLTIPEAARELGVSSEAVRGRVKRGTLQSERDADGAVYVLLHQSGQSTADQAATDHRPSADPPRDQSELVEELRSRVESLEHQLEEANTRDRENRRLLAAALERVPELEPAPQQEPHEDREETPSAPPDNEPVGGSGNEPRNLAARLRRWWRG